jgi:hypothetical protein
VGVGAGSTAMFGAGAGPVVVPRSESAAGVGAALAAKAIAQKAPASH